MLCVDLDGGKRFSELSLYVSREEIPQLIRVLLRVLSSPPGPDSIATFQGLGASQGGRARTLTIGRFDHKTTEQDGWPPSTTKVISDDDATGGDLDLKALEPYLKAARERIQGTGQTARE